MGHVRGALATSKSECVSVRMRHGPHVHRAQVRSRAFSGAYTGGTFIGALVQLFGAATLALVYALVLGGRRGE